MRQEIEWLNDAIAAKDIVEHMTYYRVKDNCIAATNGRLTAGHPWTYKGEFLVSGEELEKVLARLPGDPTVRQTDDGMVMLRYKRFHGTIATLPITDWLYPGVDDAQWRPIPTDLIVVLKDLRPFISDNAVQPWAMGLALDDGWAYATNNVVIASAKCEGAEGMQGMLPKWAVDFLATRTKHLVEWCWAPHYVAFRWGGDDKDKISHKGAWMRSSLIESKFPEKAAQLARDAHNENPTQAITDDFKESFDRIASIAEDAIHVHAYKITSTFKRAAIEEGAECEVPDGSECSTWGASFLAPVIKHATHWQPSNWPKATPWKGPLLAGYIAGRR